MSCNPYINFDGTCRPALEFYQSVFKLEAPQIMTYGDAPGLPPDASDEDKNRVLHAMLPICGSHMMFSDCPASFPLVQGNNVTISLGFAGKEEATRIYNELSAGGVIHMPLEKTFFSELFSMFTDKFGILWQVSLES